MSLANPSTVFFLGGGGEGGDSLAKGSIIHARVSPKLKNTELANYFWDVPKFTNEKRKDKLVRLGDSIEFGKLLGFNCVARWCTHNGKKSNEAVKKLTPIDHFGGKQATLGLSGVAALNAPWICHCVLLWFEFHQTLLRTLQVLGGRGKNLCFELMFRFRINVRLSFYVSYMVSQIILLRFRSLVLLRFRSLGDCRICDMAVIKLFVPRCFKIFEGGAHVRLFIVLG